MVKLCISVRLYLRQSKESTTKKESSQQPKADGDKIIKAEKLETGNVSYSRKGALFSSTHTHTH